MFAWICEIVYVREKYGKKNEGHELMASMVNRRKAKKMRRKSKRNHLDPRMEQWRNRDSCAKETSGREIDRSRARERVGWSGVEWGGVGDGKVVQQSGGRVQREQRTGRRKQAPSAGITCS